MENRKTAEILAWSIHTSAKKNSSRRVDALSQAAQGIHSRISVKSLEQMALDPPPALKALNSYWPFSGEIAPAINRNWSYWPNRTAPSFATQEECRTLEWLEEMAGNCAGWLWDKDLNLKWPLSESEIEPLRQNATAAPSINLAALQQEMKESGSVLIPDLLLPPIREGLVDLYTKQIDTGLWLYGDKQSPDRFWANNEWTSRLLQLQLLRFIQQLVGESVHPTFSTVMRYEHGSELTPHKDREQAWYTLTITLQCQQGPNPMAWPFFVQHLNPDAAEKRYVISPGSAVLFTGEELIHRRDKIPDNGQCLMMCLHFSKENFHGRHK